MTERAHTPTPGVYLGKPTSRYVLVTVLNFKLALTVFVQMAVDLSSLTWLTAFVEMLIKVC